MNSSGSGHVGTAMIVLFDSSADAERIADAERNAKYSFLQGASARGKAFVYFGGAIRECRWSDQGEAVRARESPCMII